MSLFKQSLHWSSSTVISLFTVFFVSIAVVSVVVGLLQSVVFLSEERVLYLFSTSAEVLAGIYGLTLTGFIFFRNELTRETETDETLAEAAEFLKARHFNLLLFVTLMTGLSLLLANLAIVFEPSIRNRFVSGVINVGQSAYATTLLAIAYFIFDVIYPKRMEIASGVMQDRVDPSASADRRGSLEDFYKNYNQIERLLTSAGFPYQNAQGGSGGGRPRRVPNWRMAEILLRRQRISKALFGQLRELMTLRNSISHGAEPAVTQRLVDLSKSVLDELSVVLDDSEEQRH